MWRPGGRGSGQALGERPLDEDGRLLKMSNNIKQWRAYESGQAMTSIIKRSMWHRSICDNQQI